MQSMPATLRAMMQLLLHVLLFEILYKLLTACLFRPVLSFIMQVMLNVSRRSIAFNADIWRFLFHPIGLFAAVLLAIISAVLVYYEYAVLILLTIGTVQRKPMSPLHAMKLGFTAMDSLCSIGLLGFAAYALGLLPVVHMGLYSSLLPRTQIPNFITGELSKTPLGGIALALLGLLLTAGFLALVFTLPSMVLAHARFGRAVRNGWGMLRRIKGRDIAWFACFLALWCALFVWPGFIPADYPGVTDASIYEIIGNLFGRGTFFLSLLGFWGAGLLRLCLMTVLLAMLVGVYCRAGGAVIVSEEALPGVEARMQSARRAGGKLWANISALFAAMAARIRRSRLYTRHKRAVWAVSAALILGIIQSILAAPPGIHAPIVIGHRGSATGVENTLASLQGAIDAGADYAEIDILLSADGVPMVIHDANLKRLTGENVNVYDLTAAELKAFTLRQNGYEARIPTLAEALEYCRGRIHLLIELKAHGHEQESVARRTVEIVRQAGAEKNCMYMSLDARLVEEVREWAPNARIGYCVYGNIGRLAEDSLWGLNVDFLAIEENMVSVRFVDKCKKAWLPCYVWTVNKPASMDAYVRMGVVGLITDRPHAAREVLDRYDRGDAWDAQDDALYDEKELGIDDIYYREPLPY